jgi:hypothetical protein
MASTGIFDDPNEMSPPADEVCTHGRDLNEGGTEEVPPDPNDETRYVIPVPICCSLLPQLSAVCVENAHPQVTTHLMVLREG